MSKIIPADRRFEYYQGRIKNGHGLLAFEWDDWERLYKFYDPTGYKEHEKESRRKLHMKYAAHLSVEDLKEIIRQKEEP